MTHPPLNLEDKIKRLTKAHSILLVLKQEYRLRQLHRMIKFYEDKAREAPEKQRMMFLGFVGALKLAVTTITMYSSLTKDLANLAEKIEKK